MPRVRRPRRRLLPARAPAAPLVPGVGAAPGIGAAPGGMPPGAAPGGMPMMKKGGKVKQTGPHLLHKGEKVVPAKGKPTAHERDRMTEGIGAAAKRGKFPPRKKR